MALVFNTPEEAQLGTETVQAINELLFAAQARGMSLPGAFNVLAHCAAMILVSAYKNGSTRSQAASALPDVIEAYIPQWEQIIDGARARREGGEQS